MGLISNSRIGSMVKFAHALMIANPAMKPPTPPIPNWLTIDDRTPLKVSSPLVRNCPEQDTIVYKFIHSILIQDQAIDQHFAGPVKADFKPNPASFAGSMRQDLLTCNLQLDRSPTHEFMSGMWKHGARPIQNLASKQEEIRIQRI